MRINRHNLTLVQHCASKVLQGTITNGLQFTKTGTTAVNGAYSVAVTALAADDKEPYPGCITKEAAQALLVDIPAEGKEVRLASLKFIDGVPPVVKWPAPVAPAFEIYLNADFLLKLAQSVCDFTEPRAKDKDGKEQDAVVRIQFVSQTEPVRMDARNSSGQTWEALLMPRKPAHDAERFAEPVEPCSCHLVGCLECFPVPPATSADIEAQRESWGRSCATRGERQAVVIPPPPVEEDPFEAALRLAASL